MGDGVRWVPREEAVEVVVKGMGGKVVVEVVAERRVQVAYHRKEEWYGNGQ